MSTPSMTILAAEALMLEKFRSEPFHNLRLLYGEQMAAVPGGTCSDKTLNFLRAARRAGFEVALHSAHIDGEEKHRLARVHIDGRPFFADVGNGWPALRLYPSDREVAFRCFGIGFRTEVTNGRVSVFCERRGRETLQLEVEVRGRPEHEILEAIERRFTSGVTYPFSNHLRFSQIVGHRFLFLRGNQLEIHAEEVFQEVAVDEADLRRVLREYFRQDLPSSVTWTSRAHDR